MTRLALTVVTLADGTYVAFERDGGVCFPSDTFQAGEAPAAAAHRVIAAWTGTKDPKLELMDFKADGESLEFLFRAHLTSDPAGDGIVRHPRGALPTLAGSFTADDVEAAQKTSLSYKLTRV